LFWVRLQWRSRVRHVKGFRTGICDRTRCVRTVYVSYQWDAQEEIEGGGDMFTAQRMKRRSASVEIQEERGRNEKDFSDGIVLSFILRKSERPTRYKPHAPSSKSGRHSSTYLQRLYSPVICIINLFYNSSCEGNLIPPAGLPIFSSSATLPFFFRYLSHTA
jgi:hypothetical protein